MEKVIKWQSVKDLPENWKSMINDEISELFALKKKKTESQKDSEAMKAFNDRIERRWLIETGVIEELYYIGRETSDKLVKEGVNEETLSGGITDKPAKEIIPLINDHSKALKWIYNFIVENRELNIQDIKELHKILTDSQYIIQKEKLEKLKEESTPEKPCEPEEKDDEEKTVEGENPGNPGVTEEVTNEVSPEIKEPEKTEESEEIEQKEEKKTEEKVKVELERHQKSGIIEEAREKLKTLLCLKGSPGEWKTEENNTTRPDGTKIEYCPPGEVHTEIAKLLGMQENHKKDGIPPEIEAAWLLHRFLSISPFDVGNNRVALCLASLVLLKSGWFPLTIYRNSRYAYFDAIEQADRGDLLPLVNLFTQMQKKTFMNLPGLTKDALDPHQHLKELIKASVEKIRENLKIDKAEVRKVFDFADGLKELAFNEMEEVSELITNELLSVSPEYFSGVRMSDMSNNYYFHQEIAENAKELNYYPNIREYREWVRLHIIEERKTYMVISLHGYGRDFTGTMAVSAFSYEKDEDEDGERRVTNIHKICDDTFQFSYNEDYREIEHRFKEWLIKSITNGLEIWKGDL